MAWRICIGIWLFSIGACHRPLVADADPTGIERLPLRGTPHQEAVLDRDVRTDGRTLARGTRVQIWETWLLRKDRQSKPPGYRITGYYDPTQPSERFVLPRGAIRVYFYGPPVGGTLQQSPVAIPEEAVRIQAGASPPPESDRSPYGATE